MVVGQLIRVDFNVPLDKTDPTKITNTQRIDAALPTIQYALKQGASAGARTRAPSAPVRARTPHLTAPASVFPSRPQSC